MTCDHVYVLEGYNDDFQRLVCDRCGDVQRPSPRVSAPRTFEEQVLKQIADALGLTAEQLTTDYDSCFTPEEKAARNWWVKYDQLMRFYDARMYAAWANAIFHAAIWTVESYCGYDPQKLLPHHKPNYDLWDRETLASIIADLPASENVFESFFPKAGKPQRYYIEGGHFDMFAPGVWDPDTDTIYFEHPPCRNLAPYIVPTGRISYPHLLPDLMSHGEAVFTVEAKWPHKMAVVPIESLDFSHIELRALLATEGIRSVFIDIESRSGDIAGNPQLSLYAQGRALAKEQYVEKVAKKAPPSYMKHDPTKQHGRRKRK